MATREKLRCECARYLYSHALATRSHPARRVGLMTTEHASTVLTWMLVAHLITEATNRPLAPLGGGRT